MFWCGLFFTFMGTIFSTLPTILPEFLDTSYEKMVYPLKLLAALAHVKSERAPTLLEHVVREVKSVPPAPSAALIRKYLFAAVILAPFFFVVEPDFSGTTGELAKPHTHKQQKQNR